ncbi:hypothetical protein I3843_07G015300 [Carya illinoinensis]|uniref:Uncharacterized protein n=1 Tax=Carya illinoinensis TaxID=32201 RepID=A0A922EFN9_CARIL|nr:hypothetical protein I3760_07G015500 [Carya illinoinensis]KAG6702085.1 hypothetical protein I3842_07G016600 [Carya illinoinensis]KAG7969124.1 hypothetical protein I3843_07G015300 [Carya illinoinensis]
MARDGSVTRETCNSWPFRIRLTTDHLRWDSLKILPSKEFEEHILGNMNEASNNALEAWIPVELSIHDANTHETYSVKLAKKEAFWFKPTPFLDEKQRKEKPFYPYSTMMDQPCYDWEEARKEFAYSIEPFRHVVKKRNLNYNQEIGLRWSGSEAVKKLEFSVLYVPRLDLHSLRI